MKWFPVLLTMTLAPLALAETLTLQWQWHSQDGNRHHITFSADEGALDASRREMTTLDRALNFPLETLFAQMGEKLQGTLAEINRLSPEGAVKFDNLEQAFALRDQSPQSVMFWQAYHQYQEDAFYALRITPCIHPTDRRLPCVRPNYSQLFYQLKHALQPLARQFAQSDTAKTVALLQEWLDSIPSPNEQVDHFAPPLQALQQNRADSDEKALLMAALLAELLPDYALSIIYPDISVGSVSPAWLAITADSGLQGETVQINSQPHVLLTGSPVLVQQMMLSKIPLVSEPLY